MLICLQVVTILKKIIKKLQLIDSQLVILHLISNLRYLEYASKFD
jgi:hypothetical protein